MTRTWLDDQIDLFDPSIPIEAAWLPPSSWYAEPGIHDVERNTVFRENWLIAATADQLRTPGDFVAGRIANEPYVVVRGQDRCLRAFDNVCRHHAAQVVIGEGNADCLVCPYHGWTYDLDGALLRAPELGGARDFDRDRFGLVPMAVAEWGPFVFISRADSPRPLSPDLRVLLERLEATDLRGLRFVERRSYTLECNWKVFIDNYLDGGHHVVHAHPGLAGPLDLSSRRTGIFDTSSIQSGAGGDTGEAGSSDLRDRNGDALLHAWIYPNFMINRYGPVMDTNRVLPRGHDRTEVVFDCYILETRSGDADFVARSLEASDALQKQDIAICESVQRGLESTSSDRGRYSVKPEPGKHHFHRLLAADFAARSPGR